MEGWFFVLGLKRCNSRSESNRLEYIYSKEQSSQKLFMKKVIKSKTLSSIVVVFIITVWATLYHKDREYNKLRCETQKKAINGVITRIEGRTGYMSILADNKQRYCFDIASIKSKKGFGENHDYEVGDSVFKEANTNEVQIKRGDSTCILILKCDD